MTLVFSDIVGQFPGSDKNISSTCTALALPAVIVLRSLVHRSCNFGKCFGLLHYLSQSSNKKCFFLDIGDMHCSLFGFVTTGMVYIIAHFNSSPFTLHV